ncbi:MAG: hypothetical protein J6Y10_05675 [Lachnospiraceae bacterium]|nr:hypothetical protein [Lachnospiraceae bacterium]
MTIWEAMTTLFRESLVGCSMILLLLLCYLLLELHGLRRSSRIMIIPFAVTLANLVLFYFLLDCIFHYEEPEKPRIWPSAVNAFGKLPLSCLIAAEVLTTTYLVFAFCRLSQYRREHLTPLSVKKAIDLLPAGVAFATEEGSVVFANLTMNKLSRALTGRVLTDTTPILTLGENEGSDIFRLAVPNSSSVWQFSSDSIDKDGSLYRRLIATDISAQAAVNKVLQEKHDKLTGLNRRLDIYNRNAERIIISQELLNARMQVHNETGHILLACRHYMDHPSAVEEEGLLMALKLTNAHLLNEYESDDTERDALSEAIEMASSIGVKVRLTGMIPERGDPRAILAAAVSECATNVRKHADGDTLTVTTSETDGLVSMTLIGNGNSVTKPVTESGGLASLRRLTEQAGGTMEITAAPDFTLTIHVPAAGL